jgi:hypothetical protein
MMGTAGARAQAARDAHRGWSPDRFSCRETRQNAAPYDLAGEPLQPDSAKCAAALLRYTRLPPGPWMTTIKIERAFARVDQRVQVG